MMRRVAAGGGGGRARFDIRGFLEDFTFIFDIGTDFLDLADDERV